MAEKSKYLKGKFGTAVKVALALSCLLPFLYVIRVNEIFGLMLYAQQVGAVFLGFMLALTFITMRARKGKSGNVPWYDIVFAILSVVVTFYVAARYEYLITRVTLPPMYEIVMATIMVILILEATRRHLGWVVVAVAVFFVFYALCSNIFPGFLNGKAYPWSGLAPSLYYFDDGVFGIVLRTMASVMIPFIILGGAIMLVGGDKVLMDLSTAVVGRFRGGAAKAATVVSMAFGSIVGSPSANAAVCGVVTIPLMKKWGYSATYAGAVEAISSTGGNIMPPVMGSVAFVMAEYLGVSYGAICIAALIPALLFYLGVFMQVDLQAGKMGLKGLPAKDLPPVWPSIIASWWIVIPFVVLLSMMFFFHYPTELCGASAIGTLIVCRLFTKKGRLGPKNLFASFHGAGRSMLMIGTVGAMAGIIIGSVTMSGLGAKISMVLVQISGGNVIALLVLTGVVCIILGMGLPVITAYIMLALLVTPALVQMGITPLAAHMFIFFYATLSFITPPVAVAAYVAAGIAEASPFRVGFQAMRLGVITAIAPFVFVFQPALLMNGSALMIILFFIGAIIGTVFISILLEGFLFKRINWITRILFGAAGVALLTGHPIAQGSGLVVGVLCLLWEWRSRSKMQYQKQSLGA